MRTIMNFSRLLVGLVFIFSGFVKGVDPLGTAYRIDDYFIAYGVEWAIPFSLFLSISLCTLEFVLGISLLFNAWIKKTAWLLFPLMIFFTILTLIDAIWEPVPDCGCFGDAIKLSNWETFYKNVVLILLVAVIFYSRRKYRPPQNRIYAFLVLLLASLGFVWFNNYNLQHLPIVDFREWKVGNDMEPEGGGEAKIYLTYKNKQTGEEKEYLSPDYPWQDSVWTSQWEFVDQRVDDSEVLKAHELIIQDSLGEDYTEFYIPNPDYQFMVISYDINYASESSLALLNGFYTLVEADGHSLIGITSSLPEEVAIKMLAIETEGRFEFYYADDIVLKSMIRANPGVILMKDGIVLAKWNANDLPEYQIVKTKYMNE